MTEGVVIMKKIDLDVVSSDKVKKATEVYFYIKISDNPEKDKEELVLIANSQGYDYTVDDVLTRYSDLVEEEVFLLYGTSGMTGMGFNPQVYRSVTPVEELMSGDCCEK